MTQPFIDPDADTLWIYDSVTVAIPSEETTIYIRDYPGSIRREGAYGNTQN